MVQQINQFKQTPVKGTIDLNFGPGPVSCQVDSGEATPLVPGQAVKLVDSVGGVPKITAVTAQSDIVFGFVAFTFKDASYPANAAVDILGFQGGIMWMEASEAIARGGKCSVVVSGQKVEAAEVGEYIFGYAFDKASANGDLIRVVVSLGIPGSGFEFGRAATVAAATPSPGVAYAQAEALSVFTQLNAVIASLKAAGLMA